MESIIFDIGMHNGDDSAYYLHLGHFVVGVDANPELTQACEERFAAEIRAERMTILNVGILDRPGRFTFYRNLTDSGWSSFDREKGTQGGRWEEISVPCCTTKELVERFGRPEFMKVDIEGLDVQALESLTPDTCPDYVSLELSLDDQIVKKLADLGYRRFKFVHGATFRQSTPIFGDEPGWRLLRKISRKLPVVKPLIGALPHHKLEFDPNNPYSPDGYNFTRYSSGPFGRKTHGKWMSSADAHQWIAKLRDKCRSYNEPLWYDVHAHRAG